MAMSQQHTPPVNKYTGSYTEDAGGDGVRMNAFGHEDADIAFDPLSAVLGTLVFAGPTRESIDVMVPDYIVPPENGSVWIDLRDHVSLSLGPAVDMSNWVPETQLGKALCPTSLAKTLGLQRKDYWEELNPILKKWKSVNDGRCPECARPIRVNMARHLRLVHTKYVCFWRCPVLSCSLWFTSDHIEGIHHFREGHGTSFYLLLRVPEAIRHGVVREAGLRGTTTGYPGHLDGPSFGMPVGPGTEDLHLVTSPKRNYRRDQPWKSERGTWNPPSLCRDE